MTDEQTDTQNYDSQNRASIAASCGKNESYILNVARFYRLEDVADVKCIVCNERTTMIQFLPRDAAMLARSLES